MPFYYVLCSIYNSFKEKETAYGEMPYDLWRECGRWCCSMVKTLKWRIR